MLPIEWSAKINMKQTNALKFNILFILNWYVYYSAGLINVLAERHSVSVMLDKNCREITDGSEKPECVAQKLFSKNVKLYLIDKLRVRWVGGVIYSLIVFRLILKEKIDILHFQGDIYLPLCWIIRLFRKKVRVVLTLHDITPHPGDISIRHWKKKFASLKRLHKFADRIIVHGRSLKKKLQEINTKCGDLMTHVIPHGQLDIFKLWASEEEPSEVKNKQVLFIGRIYKYKGLRYLIEAEPYVSGECPDVEFVIAGTGDDLNQLRQEIIKRPHIKLVDKYLSNSEIARLVRQSYIIVLPYIEASQSGIVALSYAFQKPVVATAVGAIPEVVIDGKYGLLVEPKNVQKLARAIVLLLKNEDLYSELVNNIGKLVKEKLSWDSISQKTEQVYREIF